MLERTGCPGGCPVYSLWIGENGTVTYEGRANVQRVGRATGKITPEQVAALLGELENGGYFSFENRYLYGSAGCQPYAADLPSAITTVAAGGRTKRIEHDYGCRNSPPKLQALERRIDEVAQSKRWVGSS